MKILTNILTEDNFDRTQCRTNHWSEGGFTHFHRGKLFLSAQFPASLNSRVRLLSCNDEIMINNSPKVLLLIVIMITGTVWLPDAMGSSFLKRPNPPSKSDLEKIFGKPIECPTALEEGVCYNSRRGLVVVHFNSFDHAQSIMINTGVGLGAVTQIADEIIQKNNRGKLLNRIEKTKPGDCTTNYTEDYKYLTIEYYAYNCQNSMPASIEIVWKR